MAKRRRLRKSAVYAIIALAMLICAGLGWVVFIRPNSKKTDDKPTGGMATPEAPVIEVDPGQGMRCCMNRYTKMQKQRTASTLASS